MTKSSNKTVSVILPNYNYAKYISSRLDEILNQTYKVSELIILDDASTDNSIAEFKRKISEIKKSYPNLKIIAKVNQKNSGNVFSQWQKGIKLATSDYIWIAELDDSAKPAFLEAVMVKFADKETVLSYANSKFIDENGKLVLKDNLRKIKDTFRKNLQVYNTVPNVSAAVFKNQPQLAEFLEEAKKYQLSGDWFFYLKISETGKIAFTNKSLNLHRLHKNSVTKTTDLKRRFAEMQKIHQYVLENMSPDERTEKAIKNLEQKLEMSWGLA